MGPDGTSSSRSDTSALAPIRMSVRAIRARSGAPTAQRMTIGRSRRTPSGTSRRTPWLQKPRASAASFSSSGRPWPPSISARNPSGSRSSAWPNVSRITPAAIAAGSSTSPATPSSRRSISPATPSGSSVEAIAFGALAVQHVRSSGGQLGVPQVEVGRVQLVRLDRQPLEGLERGEPLGAQPVGLGALGGEGLREIPRRRSGTGDRSGPGEPGEVVVTRRVIRATPPSPASPGG